MTKIFRFILLLTLALPAAAQNFMTVIGQSVYGRGNQLLAAGQVSFAPVDNQGRPTGYQIGGGGQQVFFPTTCAVRNGAIQQPCQLANVSLTNPINVCFSATVKDSSNQVIIGGPQSGYTCAQPQTANFWCASGTCNFDQFVPNLPAAITALIGPPRANQLGSIYAGDCPSGQVATGYSVTGRPDCTPGGGGGGGVTDPGANGIMKRTALNVTAPAIAADVIATLGFTPADNSFVAHLAGNETLTGTKTFLSPISGSITGNAATALALSGTPSLCNPGEAPLGILANGNATGCFAFTAGLGDPGANGVIKRTSFNTTQPANAGDIATTLGFTPANNSLVAHLAGTETITGGKTFSSAIVASGGVTGNSSTATALLTAPAICAAGSAPRGIIATGDASNCASLGMADSGNTGIVKRTTFNVTVPALGSDVNTTLGYTPANDALVLHAAGTESVSGVKTFQTNIFVSSEQNRLGDYLPLISAPTGTSQPGILALDAPNGYLQIQADSGAGANLGGVLNLQSTNGPNSVALASLLVGSSGFQVNASGMTVFSGGGLKTIITGPGLTQFGNVGGTRGQPTYVGNTSGSVLAGCADATCSSFAISGAPLTLSAALGTAYGGLGWTDTTASGNTHKLATVAGAITANCAQFDASGNITATGNPCGTGTGGLADPGSNGVLKRTALNTTAIALSADVISSLGFTPANDAAVVHLTGNETVAGTKTFSSTVAASISGNSATATALAANPADCSAGAAANTIDASGNLGGCIAVPTASNANPLVNGTAAPGTGTAFSRSDHVHPTDTSRAADTLVVHLAGTETIAGAKTFSSAITGNLSGNATTATSATTATTATVLAGPVTNCAANSAATGINTSGVAQGCFTPVLLASDLGNTAAAPRVISTHIAGATLNALMRADTNGNMVNSGWTDDGTTSSYNGTGAGLDAMVFSTAQSVVPVSAAWMAPTSGTAYIAGMPSTPVSGLLRESTTVSTAACTATATNLCGTFGPVDLSAGSDVGSSVGGVANGMTGVATIANHGVMMGRGTSAIATLVPGAQGRVFQSNGAGNDPVFSTTLNLGGVSAAGNAIINLSGITGGTISVQVQGNAGTYNLNLWTTAGASGQPALSGGGGASPMTWGSLSGNTGTFATVSGAVVSGNCGQWDASGNLVDSGNPCGGGSGSGVDTSVVPRIAYYNTTTSVIGDPNTALGDGTANPVMSLTGTSLAKESLLVNCTTPVANCVSLQVGGVTKLGVDNSGFVLLGGTVTAAAGVTYRTTTGSGNADYTAGTDATQDAASSVATLRGAKMSAANANGAGAAVVSGGDLTNTGAATGATGAATVRGGNCAGTGACTVGDLIISPGALTNASPSASAIEGRIVFNANVFRKGTTVTAGNLACITGDDVIQDCATAASNIKFVGVNSSTSGGSAYAQALGQATLNLAASSTWTAGDVICSSPTSAAQMYMNGAANCPSGVRRVGFAIAGGTAATTVKALLQFGPQINTATFVGAAQTAAISATTLLTTPASNSMYVLGADIDCNTAVAAATATLTLTWTDTSNTAQTTTSTATCTALGSGSFASVDGKRVNVKGGTNITYAVAIANSPNYDVRIDATQVTAN